MKKILILILSIYGVLGAQTQLDPAIASAINSQCCGGTSTSSIIYVDSVSNNTAGDSLIVFKNGIRYAYKYPSGSTYTLPIATTSVLGGVKDGSGVLIKPDGTINAEVQTFAQNGSNFLVFTRDTSGTGTVDTFKWTAPDFWRSSVAVPVNANGMPDGVNDTIEFIQHRNDIFIGGADGLVRAGQGAGNQVENTVFGRSALFSNTTGVKNTAMGYLSLRVVSTGSNNTSYGAYTMQSLTTGGSNTAIGSNSMTLSTTSTGNTAIGSTSLYNNTTGSSNTAVGNGAMAKNVNGDASVGIGSEALRDVTVSSFNTAVGFQSQGNTPTSVDNTSIGAQSLRFNTGTLNTAIGRGSLQNQSTGFYNIAIGGYSGSNITTGAYNTVIGTGGGANSGGLTTGSDNIAIGSISSVNGFNEKPFNQKLSPSNAQRNVIVGNGSSNRLLGNDNTIIGFGTGAITNGNNNVILGAYSYGPNTTNGWNGGDAFAISNNTFIGSDINRSTISQVQIGDNNSALGYGAMLRVSGITGTTCLGANSVATKSNQMVLGSSAMEDITTFGYHNFQKQWDSSVVANQSLFVDSANGKLSFKDSSGNVFPLY